MRLELVALPGCHAAGVDSNVLLGVVFPNEIQRVLTGTWPDGKLAAHHEWPHIGARQPGTDTKGA